MPVFRVDHINLATPRFDESLHFYMEVLGLVRGRLPGAMAHMENVESRAAWLYDDSGHPIVHMFRREEAGEEADLAPVPTAFDHVALGCKGFAGMEAKLKALGVTYRPVIYRDLGVCQLVIHDPNGIKIELNFDPAEIPADVAGDISRFSKAPAAADAAP